MAKARVPSDPATSGQALTPHTGTPTGRVCYCKHEIGTGDRIITLTLAMDWGTDDLRDAPPAKTYDFHSFACVEQWAHDRALAHDDVVVREGKPAK